MDVNRFFYDLDDMLSKGKAKEAVQYVNEAIGQAEKEQDKRALVAVYNEAGGLCRDFSRYEEAESYYKEALSLIEEMGAAESESHGTTLMALVLEIAAGLMKLRKCFPVRLKYYQSSAWPATTGWPPYIII